MIDRYLFSLVPLGGYIATIFAVWIITWIAASWRNDRRVKRHISDATDAVLREQEAEIERLTAALETAERENAAHRLARKMVLKAYGREE
jgi:hypothetical protein